MLWYRRRSGAGSVMMAETDFRWLRIWRSARAVDVGAEVGGDVLALSGQFSGGGVEIRPQGFGGVSGDLTAVASHMSRGNDLTASATVPAATAGSAALQGGEHAPLGHNLIWIPWDDTIYSSYSACMRRGAYLAGVYTDIVDYQCRNRSTVNVRPTRFGMMLEVKRS